MPSNAEIADKLWSAIASDRTIMIGVATEPDRSQPMTGLLENETAGPICIFSARDVDLVQAVEPAPQPAVATFASKGHDVFASLRGKLSVANDAAVIERLWNPFVAAWYEGGKTDPALRLLRFDLDHAHVWLNENSLFAGLKLLLGGDPKEEYGDKTADLDV